MIRFFYLGFTFLMLNCSLMNAQSAAKDDFTANAIRYFQQFAKVPYEKLYLQLDKPYYSAGENIWYSGYLMDGINSTLSPYSNYIYVELINKSDSVVMRYKTMKDSLGLAGNIPIPSDFPAGDYHVRAYSWWMQNSGTDYFFQKNIHIGNEIDKSIQSSITYTPRGANQIGADIKFSSDEKVSFKKRLVEYKIYEGKKLKRTQRASIDNEGHLRFGFEANPQNKSQYRIQIALDDDKVNFKKDFFFSKNYSDFDCQFFPEGGELLNNGIRNVAFKAVGQDGYSVEVEGTVLNEKGDSIVSFKSQHKGMGTFSFPLYNTTPVKYYAKVHIKGTNENHTFSLPEVKETGIGVTVLSHKDRLFYNLIAADKKPYAEKKLYLLAQQQGNLQTIISISDTVKWEGSLNKEALLPGIIHFVLLDEEGNALSQRIAFVNKPQQNFIRVTLDKNIYSFRSPVKLALSLQNQTDTAIAGRFSIAVTEDKTVKTDTLADNICSSLLLTSDLKGYIEDPGHYFNGATHTVDPKIDLVMLTHGWTRFDVPSVLKGKPAPMDFYLEKGQSFSGKITNFFGHGAKDAQLIVIGMKNNIFMTTTANDKGQFVVDGLMFPDSTTFIVQARSKKGHSTVELQMDRDHYPAVQSMYPFPGSSVNQAVDNYMNIMSQKYHYEGGMRVYHLKEVIVTANKIEHPDENPLYSGLGNPIRTEEIDKRYMGRTVLDIVRDFPGVSIRGNLISVRGSRSNPTLMLDDIKYSFGDDIVEMLSTLNADEVAYVNLIKGAEAAIFGGNGGNGVIVVNLKRGGDYSRPSTPSLGLAVVRPLGYYKAGQFYSPKYETDEQKQNANPDLRTTIYWNPSIILKQNKVSPLSFYTADSPGTYNVIVEGVTNTGEPIHYQTKLTVK